jgi:oxygen-independent coproporphyrinogen III oxidase
VNNIYWNEQLIRKYDLQGPRYTSYPTAVEFNDHFPASTVRQAARLSQQSNRPLSLYFHIPFCARLCYYCACNKIVTKRREKAQPYLDLLYREMAMQAAMFSQQRQVEQLHWGGGTPTFLSPAQMRELMATTRSLFQLRNDDAGDYSIEIDPREADDDILTTLREIGFNRISLGVQDFNADVQKAVNRIQSEELTLSVLEKARALGFRSINIDLIYGLPHQTTTTFANTVSKIIDFAPDRLSVFNYAHLPDRFAPQRRIGAAALPPAEAKLEILHNTVDQLVAADYRFIGMDHFAKADDTLAIAQECGELHRNFQGYTTHGNCDLIAMGVSSISMLDRTYYQNQYTIEAYEEAILQDILPVKRGIELTREDVLRRYVIGQLICNFKLSMAVVESLFDLKFTEHFANELSQLSDMAADGLIKLTADSIVINPSGRLLIRVICKAFDQYRNEEQKAFSKII